MKNSFADKIRKTVAELGGDGSEVTAHAIFDTLGITLSATKSRVYYTLRDLRKSGEVERVDKGLYRWRGKQAPPELRQKMWKLLRKRFSVTVEDLMELAGASEQYAKEWLTALHRRGVIQRIQPGHYRIIKDTVEMPDLDDNARKLRRFREKKKQEILKSINDIETTVMEAKSRIESCLKSWEE